MPPDGSGHSSGTGNAPASPGLRMGDPVPWFEGRTIAGKETSLGVIAGRWVVLALLGALEDPRSQAALDALLAEKDLFDFDQRALTVVLTALPTDLVPLLTVSSINPAIEFVADKDGSVTRLYGAAGTPRILILDPLLHALVDVPLDGDPGTLAGLIELLHTLPDVEDSAGVPMTAPALVVPRVLDLDFCERMIAHYHDVGGEPSGVLHDIAGKTRTLVDPRVKRRRDVVIRDATLREELRDQIARRLAPAIERFFQFRPTRMDRSIVVCYDAADGGHFARHRDNMNAGARHRRFAVTLNLNFDFDGGDLVFPEFGRRRYTAPCGGAIVFSTGALHQVTPVTRGQRFAIVPFLYGEGDVATRLAANADLAAGEAPYSGTDDRLLPD